MQIQTTRFGTLEIQENLIIHFPRGIPGFENLQRFFFIPVEGAPNLQWMQAADDPAVALLVIDPFKYFKDYTCDIPENDIRDLGIKDRRDALLLTTVTIPRGNPGGATANLVAPIIINTRLNRGKQVILTGSSYTTKHRLFPGAGGSSTTKEEEGKVVAGEGK